MKNPLTVAAKFNVQLTAKQLQGLHNARAFESDSLLQATMCPKSSGYEDISPKRNKKKK
ncbi:hypothetical protein J4471_04200 [Candidatus Woesearchaeota archaeon]|nr:hypothetical protein [Candidatus Woesearchaeota archaeon]